MLVFVPLSRTELQVWAESGRLRPSNAYAVPYRPGPHVGLRPDNQPTRSPVRTELECSYL